jgi:DHA2 family multidrug resistance protein
LSGSDEEWRPHANPWLIAVTVTLAAFMEVLDTTIVNVSLPHIAGSMSVSYDDATWTLTSYLVANGIVLPISGWLGSVFGRKHYFLFCIAAFTVCSFLCGIASSLWQLILFRLLQGFFGGGLQPNQQAIILDTFPPALRGRAFAVTAIATVVAPVLGPTVGGWITDHYTWRWIFFINIPVGIATFFAVTQWVEDPPWARKESRGIDYIGLGLIALGLGCLQIVLDRGEDADWLNSSFIRLFLVLTVIGLLGAVTWLLTTRNPVVNLRVLADRNFAVGSVMIFAMAAILYSSAVVIPRFSQEVLGYNATLAGLVLSPGALLVVVLIPLVGQLMRVVQTRLIIAFGFFLLGTALLYSQGIVPNIDFTTLMLMRAAQSAGLAFLFVPISTLAYATLSRAQNGDAAALFTMFRNLAGSIGISVASALVISRGQVREAYLVGHLTPLDPGYQASLPALRQGLAQVAAQAGSAASRQGVDGLILQTLHQQSSVLAYMDVFSICATMAFCLVPLTFLFTGGKAGGESR